MEIYRDGMGLRTRAGRVITKYTSLVPRLLQILSPRYIAIQLWEKIGIYTPCSNVYS